MLVGITVIIQEIKLLGRLNYLMYNLCFFALRQLMCSWDWLQGIKKDMTFCILFHSAEHLLFHFIFMMIPGDENYYFYFISEENDQRRQRTQSKVKWLLSARFKWLVNKLMVPPHWKKDFNGGSPQESLETPVFQPLCVSSGLRKDWVNCP